MILDDVTIHAGPGEFVAIAGESGAGKSTLFRLALGIDRPSAGAVYYDGRDLRHLNLKQVRRKIGAVPQSVRLHPHDLWDNIVAHHEDASADEVWKAARTAGIEREIRAMPMGMMTMVGSSGADWLTGDEFGPGGSKPGVAAFRERGGRVEFSPVRAGRVHRVAGADRVPRGPR